MKDVRYYNPFAPNTSEYLTKSRKPGIKNSSMPMVQDGDVEAYIQDIRDSYIEHNSFDHDELLDAEFDEFWLIFNHNIKFKY